MNLNNEINQITNYLNNKEFKKVVSSCEKIIQLKIENTIVYNLYGLGLQKMGYFDKSIKIFEKSIQLSKK
jgi:tetratricopeptide (TPR) repeat protein